MGVSQNAQSKNLKTQQLLAKYSYEITEPKNLSASMNTTSESFSI